MTGMRCCVHQGRRARGARIRQFMNKNSSVHRRVLIFVFSVFKQDAERQEKTPLLQKRPTCMYAVAAFRVSATHHLAATRVAVALYLASTLMTVARLHCILSNHSTIHTMHGSRTRACS